LLLLLLLLLLLEGRGGGAADGETFVMVVDADSQSDFHAGLPNDVFI
jgi:hypothetical protein